MLNMQARGLSLLRLENREAAAFFYSFELKANFCLYKAKAEAAL